jgi:hypothetical protein
VIHAVEIEIVGRHPLIVPIDNVLRAIFELSPERKPSPTLRELAREAFILRVCSLRLSARMNELRLAERLVTLQHGPGFAKLVGDVQLIRTEASPRKAPGIAGEMVTVVIVFARSIESDPPIETAHLFRKNDLRLEQALERYETEGLAPTCSVIQMRASDFATCPSLNVVPEWEDVELAGSGERAK